MISLAHTASVLIAAWIIAVDAVDFDGVAGACADYEDIEQALVHDVLRVTEEKCPKGTNNCDVMERTSKSFMDDCPKWGVYYGDTRFYSIQDEVPGAGCRETPHEDDPWPAAAYASVNKDDFPAATVTAGTCGMPGFSFSTCDPTPIKKESFNRPVNKCPRVYCVTSADSRVAGEYWEDTYDFLQDDVPKYFKVDAIDSSGVEACLNTEPPTMAPPGPSCPQDTKVLKKSGATGFPNTGGVAPVTIISQDVSTVTVELRQAWFPTADAVYYSFNKDKFDSKCYGATDVEENDLYGTATIQCSAMSPVAILQICVADDLAKNNLSAEDTATIPKCCEPEPFADKAAVCYVVQVRCKSVCAGEEEARRLRG